MSSIEWPKEFPGVHWFDEAEDRAVLDVLHRGAPFRHYGLDSPRYVSAFESAVCDFYGAKHALAVNSGTGALITAVTALGIGPGCEVIVPAFMWVATITAVVNANAIPVLCEVDDSFTLDPNELKKRITSRTKLIIPVHMAGAPCDMEAITDIANEHGIRVLEDVAQCNGGSFNGKKLGTFGDIGMFSLQLNKNMTTGEGGYVVTDDDALFERLRSAHDTGYIWVDGSPTEPSPEARGWGSGRRMSELIGAVASVQIKKLPDIVDRMHGSHTRIKEMLSDVSGISFRRLNDPDGHTGPFLIAILENESLAVNAARHLQENGISSAVRLADYGLHIYSNISRLVNKAPISTAGNPWSLGENKGSVYEYGLGACPASDALFARSVILPIPSNLTEDHENWAADIIRKAMVS